ncbi:hypothetical protein K1719_006385 [Acacia pycnantha]|nr:hypothetical protein K1719_006385 [Acacia pycnantha]
MDTMRSLFSAAVDTGGGGESLLGSIKIAVLPIAKVFTMCFLGFLMASKFVNILPANGRKLLNGLVFSLLLPCLIFSQLGQAITLEKMLQCTPVPGVYSAINFLFLSWPTFQTMSEEGMVFYL